MIFLQTYKKGIDIKMRKTVKGRKKKKISAKKNRVTLVPYFLKKDILFFSFVKN